MIQHYSRLLLPVFLTCVAGIAGEVSKTDSKCVIHHVQLFQEEVPILYGKPLTSQDYSQARESQFPNARERCVIGGCIPESTKKAKVMVCPKCSDARKHWLSEHQVKDARI